MEKRARDRIDDEDALNCAKGSRIVRDFSRGLAMGDEVLGLKLRNFRHISVEKHEEDDGLVMSF